jgi:hypothetical protein
MDQVKAKEQEHLALKREAGLPAYSQRAEELWKADVACVLADVANTDPDPAIDVRRINARIAENNPEILSEFRGMYGERTDDLLVRFQKFREREPPTHRSWTVATTGATKTSSGSASST